MFLVARTDALQPGDLLRYLAIRRALYATLGRAGATGHSLELEAGNDIGIAPITQFLSRSRVVEFVPCRQDDGTHTDLFEPFLLVQVDGLGRAGLFALATGFAVRSLFDDIGVGRRPDRGLVGRFARYQASLVLTGEIHGADLGAFVAVDAQIDIHIAGTMVNLYREISRQTGCAHNCAVGHDLDAGVLAMVEQEGRD